MSDRRLEYEGTIYLSMAEGCYGTIDLNDEKKDIVEVLYEIIGAGDGTLPEDQSDPHRWYPDRRFKARVVIEVLSDVETEPFVEHADDAPEIPHGIKFDSPPSPTQE